MTTGQGNGQGAQQGETGASAALRGESCGAAATRTAQARPARSFALIRLCRVYSSAAALAVPFRCGAAC